MVKGEQKAKSRKVTGQKINDLVENNTSIKLKIRNKWFGFFGFIGFNALRYLSSGDQIDLIWAVWFVWFIYFFVGESW